MLMNSKGGAQKFIIKDNELLIHKYLDIIKYSTSITNLSTKLRPILTRNFQFHIHNVASGKKNDFSRFLFPRQNIYDQSEPKIKFKNQHEVTIKFLYNNNVITQHIHLEDFKLASLIEESTVRKQRGGQGYTVSVGQNPVGGKPVISGYYDCCRPVFLGSLMQGGKKTDKKTQPKKTQKGGKANSGYYLDLKSNHLVVQPQYRAYYNTLLPYTPPQK